jgi:uncharacterized protein
MMIDLNRDECVYALGTHDVGRLCVVENGYPVAFPVNYRLVVEPAVQDAGTPGAPTRFLIVFRTRDGGVLDVPGQPVGFQIDGVDPVSQTGWSVLVRGTLHDGGSDAAPDWLHSWDPHPWTKERESWLYLEVEVISGRQLVQGSAEWAFEIRGYL